MSEKTISTNRRARHDYEVLDRFEAGIALRGTEVKSLRGGHVSFTDSYAEVNGGELYLHSLHIPPYEQGTIWNHEPDRSRKLLMHKREIIRLGSQIAEKGLTVVPLRLYFKDGKVKVELGLARGKTKGDKRSALKEQEHRREMERATRAASRS